MQMVEDHAFPFDFGLLEVDQETKGAAGGFEVIEALGDVFRSEMLDTLEFDNECVFDKDVGEILADIETFVVNWERDLGFGLDARRASSLGERLVKLSRNPGEGCRDR